jgi:hypothetical protein
VGSQLIRLAGELAKHAVSEGTKAVTKYCSSGADPSDEDSGCSSDDDGEAEDEDTKPASGFAFGDAPSSSAFGSTSGGAAGTLTIGLLTIGLLAQLDLYEDHRYALLISTHENAHSLHQRNFFLKPLPDDVRLLVTAALEVYALDSDKQELADTLRIIYQNRGPNAVPRPDKQRQTPFSDPRSSYW